MLCADHTSTCSLDLAPLKAPIVTGSMQPRKIRNFRPFPESEPDHGHRDERDFGNG